MDGGKFSDRVTLQSPPTAKDSVGQVTGAWVDVATVWAHVRGLRSREFFAAAQVQQEATIIVTLRYRPGVLPTQRLVWDGQRYDITGVVPLESDPAAYLVLTCLGGVKDGR